MNTEKYFTVYRIINKLNGSIYVGCHETHNLNDDYMGSGAKLHEAYRQFGVENFEKSILHVFKNRQEMFDCEAFIVNEEFLQRQDVYNVALGGGGGWYHENSDSTKQREKCIRGNEKQKSLRENDPTWAKKNKESRSQALVESYKNGRKCYLPSWNGRNHKQETKTKIGAANSIHQKGEGNSQFGTVFIYNLELKRSIRVKKEELDAWLEMGWKKGRKMKFADEN